MLDFLAIFRRRGRPKTRKRKSSGTWRIELEKIGGLVKKSSSGYSARKPDAAQIAVPDSLQVEPLRDEYLLKEALRQETLLQHPLHPETVRQDGYRQEAFRAPPPQSPQARPQTPGHSDHAGVQAQVRQAPQHFVPPRPRRADPGFSQVQQGYLAAHSVEKSFGARKVVKGASLFVAARRGRRSAWSKWRRQDHDLLHDHRADQGGQRQGRARRQRCDALPMYQRARLGIGYLPQEASIFRGLNVEDNIRSVLEVVERDPKKRERELDALLDEFNIGRLRKSPSIALSGGERRRCEIARALATRPSYMLLDEPFAGIDPIAVGDIQALVRHLTQRGIGVLITDHNVRETLGLTDRAYIIYSGEVLMEGRAEDIVNNPDVRRLYLGEDFRL